MQDLNGRRIAVAGGTGDVGVGIVAELTEAGAEVIVPARSPQKAEALRDGLAAPQRLSVIEGELGDEAAVARLRGALEERGPIDGVVASLGSWLAFGPLAETTLEEVDRAYRSLLRSHLAFARAVAPLLDGGTYVVVNGGASLAPAPGSSAVSIMTRGLTMLPEVIEAEHPTIRVHTLLLSAIVATRARQDPDPSWITAREVGAAAAWFFSPLGALTAGGTVTLNARKPMRRPER